MSEHASNLQCRFRLEEAKFFYEQMKLNFQDRVKFLWFLDAFLAIARSLTHVFQTEFHNNKEIMDWYNKVAKDWQNNKIMKLFIEIRNISLKEHTPKMRTTIAESFSINFVIADKVTLKKISPDGKSEQVEVSQELVKQRKEEPKIPQRNSGIVGYSFDELPEWFDENPDVMSLCKRYLDELEKFVTEAEKA